MSFDIIVIGSINTDMVVRTAHLPMAGETIMADSFFMTGGGKGANQAVAVAKLGGNVAMVGKVGRDVFGEQAVNNLKHANVDTTYVYRDLDHPSGVALIAVADSGENNIIVASGANSVLSGDDILKAGNMIAYARYVLLQLEIPVDTVRTAIELSKKHGKKVILNPAPACILEDTLLQYVDIIIPNQSETFLMTGKNVNTINEAYNAVDWFHKKGIETVIITLGEKGCFVSNALFTGAVKEYHVNKAVDTVAAGDTFCGALAIALSEGLGIERACKFANIAAALSVTKSGAQSSIPLRIEVDTIFASQEQ